VATADRKDRTTWLQATQGLVRLDLSAPEQDRHQYFAGLRYLPDDHVEQLLPDAQGGVWVRTTTGISHIELKPMTLAQKPSFRKADSRAARSLWPCGFFTFDRCRRCFQQPHP